MSSKSENIQQLPNNNQISKDKSIKSPKFSNQGTQCRIIGKDIKNNKNIKTEENEINSYGNKKTVDNENLIKNEAIDYSYEESNDSNENDDDITNNNDNDDYSTNVEEEEQIEESANINDINIEEEEQVDESTNDNDELNDDDNEEYNSDNSYHSEESNGDDEYSDNYSNEDLIKNLPNSKSNINHHYHHHHHHNHYNHHKSQTNSTLVKSNSNKTRHHSNKRTKCTSDQRVNPKTEEGRKAIAHQTLKIIKTGKYTFRRKDNSIEEINVSKQISQCVEHTRTYKPNYYYDKKPRNPTVKKRKKMCQIEVVPESTFGSAKRLVKKEKISKTCVLNFASATKPGGGFRNGRTAQEESLSRQSALYQSLKTHPEMYKYNLKHDNDDSFYNDYMIYSPKVPVFRSDLSERLFGKNELFLSSVITSAAPNLHDVSKYQQNRKHYKTIFYERCRKILLLAIEKHNDAIVLGAYGCGVFENDPKFVSSVFKKLLFKGKNGDEPLCYYFDKVTFSITGCKSENFQVFSKRFKEYINPKRK